jgi:hypothetical protein
MGFCALLVISRARSPQNCSSIKLAYFSDRLLLVPRRWMDDWPATHHTNFVWDVVVWPDEKPHKIRASVAHTTTAQAALVSGLDVGQSCSQPASLTSSGESLAPFHPFAGCARSPRFGSGIMKGAARLLITGQRRLEAAVGRHPSPEGRNQLSAVSLLMVSNRGRIGVNAHTKRLGHGAAIPMN